YKVECHPDEVLEASLKPRGAKRVKRGKSKDLNPDSSTQLSASLGMTGRRERSEGSIRRAINWKQ
ncbi:MAG: hypothetical protein P9L88_02105, partial [Candidatus Tantalella remota]|nr:hypothetical protein [Candidatus Tantalella remota]